MNKTELAEYLKTLGFECEIREGRQFTEAAISPSGLHDLALKLKEDERLCFDFLVCITGMDYMTDFGAIYHLRSTKYSHEIVIKVRTSDRQNPEFDSVTDIWKSADFLEREVYDLLGIRFTNHPDLRRLFLNDSWGFPLRKDYVDDSEIATS
ncbi:MAG: NADH-quinone oxidoreductase subunit C [Bacteroidia bacterium]|nr:NADH-quinone oxidoreductase subunit C [Bacteroidia bacterium]